MNSSTWLDASRLNPTQAHICWLTRDFIWHWWWIYSDNCYNPTDDDDDFDDEDDGDDDDDDDEEKDDGYYIQKQWIHNVL